MIQHEKSYVDEKGNFFSHEDMVKALAKDPKEILAQLTANLAALDAWHAATGIAGEAGELLDAVKKHAVYGRAVDRANVVEELGDLRFYMQHLMLVLDITDEEVLDGNVNKLVLGPNARYKGMVYSDAAAHARADKQPLFRELEESLEQAAKIHNGEMPPSRVYEVVDGNSRLIVDNSAGQTNGPEFKPFTDKPEFNGENEA